MPKPIKGFRDIEKARRYRNEQRKLNYHNSAKNALYSGQLWNKEEIEIILNSPLCDRDISKQIGRSVQAIQAKRSKLLKEGR